MAKIDVKRGWFETVICSARRGQDARLRRALEARSAYKRRQPGCLASWVSRSHDGQPMFLVQSWYIDQDTWRVVSDSMEEHFGHQDAFEHLLSGPPLVGAFEGPNVRLTDVGNDA
jgi:hypothetical protein